MRASSRMADGSSAYRERLKTLAERLDAPSATAERDALRAELITLGKGLEHDITELTAMREEAKALVEKFKGLQASAAPAFTAEKPIVADHIGASTFIEKGWSKLSLADYCLTVNPKAWDEADVRSAYGTALALRGR